LPSDRSVPLVVVADDDAELRNLLEECLRLDGFEVETVKSGGALVDYLRGALSDADARVPDLVVSDIRMPNGTGMQVLRSLRAERRRPPFVLMTAFGSGETRLQAHRLGAAGVLSKPFDLDDFRTVVLYALSAKTNEASPDPPHAREGQRSEPRL
jgi:DNA-binding response OmpR family regulator